MYSNRRIVVFILTFLLSLTSIQLVQSQSGGGNLSTPEFSTGGFFKVEGFGREVYNFNVGWRFFKGSADGAEKPDFDDSNWQLVNLPHGLELLPDEASGSMNYQGEAWYRKKFRVPQNLEGKKVYLNFEAIMGKCKVWINGKFIGGHFGGYLPFILDVSDAVNYGDQDNSIAVLADNSDDGSYAPGQSQKLLDFTYFGGIYRDVWLIAMDKLHITNSNYSDKIAGGGLFVHYENLSDKKVTIIVKTEIENESNEIKDCTLETIIKNKNGKEVAHSVEKLKLEPGGRQDITQKMEVINPNLWSPRNPYLYDLFSIVKKSDSDEKVTDGFKTRIGIRKIEFRGKDGFYLNNKPYEGKLMGANRHQDFGYVGNALPNSIHWRDAKKLKDAGCDVIRTAHYPQDPAFMDACDELGLFYIEATPGWHFWNDDSVFIKRVYSDIRNMVRRNRNRPCVVLWEPILNEASYPVEFAKKANEITKEEYPFQGCYTSCDYSRDDAKYFDVLYSHTFQFDAMHQNYIENTNENQEKYRFGYDGYDKSFFVREYGDCVESFKYQNGPNRVHRSWGEVPQITQAINLAAPDFIYTSYESINLTPRQNVGGCLWHAFDHQRGYSPDTFYGGIMDIFRQPKYSYHMFMSQREPGSGIPGSKAAPMVYIAHEMTPFSPSDVVVFSNCDKVRLTVLGKEIGTIETKKDKGLPHYPAVFKNAYRFYDMKARFRSGEEEGNEIVAEGIIDGKVVVKSVKNPSLKATKLKLEADYSGQPLVADGSDFITVIASITDDNGNVKRLNNKYIEFEVTGEGELIGDASIHANPRRIEWGTAPALIRSSVNPGKIQITARLNEDYYNFSEAHLTIETVTPQFPLLYQEEKKPDSGNLKESTGEDKSNQSEIIKELKTKLQKAEKELNQIKLREVEKDQENVGGTKKQDSKDEK